MEIVANHRLKEEEEDVRILYVAMTRAKEQLILVGATPNDGRLERCRIGRIAAGLGLDFLPQEGGTVPLEGLDAVIARVAPSPAKAVTDRYPVLETAAAERLPVTPPPFLDSAPRSIIPRHVSFSALAAYQRCPRQYYLERVLGLELWPGKSVEEDDGLPSLEETVLDDDERDVGREIGLLVHALLERLTAADRPPTEDAMRLAAEEWLRDTGVELSADHRYRAVALTLAFWDSPLVGLRASPSAVREAPFFFGQGETLVSGVMDLIRPEGELWRIVDYKTNALKGRSPAEVASSYEMQATVYCLAALRAGAPAVQMDFVFLEQPETPVSVRRSLEDLSALESELDRALEGLRRGEFPVRQGEACESCAVVSICANVARS